MVYICHVLRIMNHNGGKSKRFPNFLYYFPTFVSRPHFLHSRSTHDSELWLPAVLELLIYGLVNLASILWADFSERSEILWCGCVRTAQWWFRRYLSPVFPWIPLVQGALYAFPAWAACCQLDWLVRLDWLLLCFIVHTRTQKFKIFELHIRKSNCISVD